jgi:homocysteine S-methyltransferase
MAAMRTTPTDPFPADGTLTITDAGLETWLLFQRGVDLPAFAAYPLASTDAGRALLADYYDRYAAIADTHGAALVLETPTWRANPEWAATLGHDLDALAEHLSASVAVVDEACARSTSTQPCIRSGVLGPRGDGYVVGATMSAAEARAYHAFQIDHFAASGIDVVTALTIGYVDEAIGIVEAAADAGLPVVISFTVETDGTLPSGMALGAAIEATDAATDGYVTHYMVNCAHPTHFEGALRGSWVERVGGVRANASTLSHAELDVMETLDDGDPDDLAGHYTELRSLLPNLRVVGGCCGTDDRHVAAIARVLASAG